MKDKTVSIIIPVYNAEKYVCDCIESILNQTYKNIEVLIIDDGSTDGSLNLLLKYEKKDSRVVLVHKSNSGVSATRNVGLNLVKGDYITFVDSDDWVEPEYIEILTSAAEAYRCDVVACNVSMDYQNQVKKRKIKEITESELLTDSKRIFQEMADCESYTLHIAGKLMKSKLIKNVRFSDLCYAEDAYFNRKIFSESNSIYKMPYAGYHYRVNGDSASEKRENLKRNMFDDIKMCMYTREICIQSGFDIDISYLYWKITYDVFHILTNEFHFSSDEMKKMKEIIKEIKGKYLKRYREKLVLAFVRVFLKFKFFYGKWGFYLL